MENLRIYGNAPYNVAVIHGGPGANGGMEYVAMELSKSMGVLEPIQTAMTVNGQVNELHETLKQYDKPFSLIGHSWGAWLAYIYAAKYPSYVDRLILVGGGPFENKYVPKIMDNRMNNLNDDDRYRTKQLLKAINSNESLNDDEFGEFGSLMSKADSYDTLTYNDLGVDIIESEPNVKIYNGVWTEAAELRASGKLLEMGSKIKSLVTAYHGKYDSHPYEGVSEPLNKVIDSFEFILMDKCGHTPWLEKHTNESFFKLLRITLKEEIPYKLRLKWNK